MGGNGGAAQAFENVVGWSVSSAKHAKSFRIQNSKGKGGLSQQNNKPVEPVMNSHEMQLNGEGGGLCRKGS